jgi:hypothetical protein
MKLESLFESAASSIDLLDYCYRTEAGTLAWLGKDGNPEGDIDTYSQGYRFLDSSNPITDMSMWVHIFYNNPTERIGGQIVKLFSAPTVGKGILIFDDSAKTIKSVEMGRLDSPASKEYDAKWKIARAAPHLNNPRDASHVKEMANLLEEDDEYRDAIDAYFVEMLRVVEGLELPRFVMYGNKSVSAIRKIYEQRKLGDTVPSMVAYNKVMQGK